MDIQVRIPPVLCALHNFIHQYDPSEALEFEEDIDDYIHGQGPAEGTLAVGPPTAVSQVHVVAFRNRLAGQMWADYQQYWAEHGGDPDML